MAWENTFNNVDWQIGQYLRESKLDQMVANDLYLQENCGYSIIAAAEVMADSHFQNLISPPSSFTSACSITIDGGTTVLDFGSWAQTTTRTHRADKDKSLGAASLGLHYLEMKGRRFYFVRTQEMDFVSGWLSTDLSWGLTVPSQAGENYDFQYFLKYQITIIGHRVAEGW